MAKTLLTTLEGTGSSGSLEYTNTATIQSYDAIVIEGWVETDVSNAFTTGRLDVILNNDTTLSNYAHQRLNGSGLTMSGNRTNDYTDPLVLKEEQAPTTIGGFMELIIMDPGTTGHARHTLYAQGGHFGYVGDISGSYISGGSGIEDIELSAGSDNFTANTKLGVYGITY